MKREVRRPSATAASTCATCFRAGFISPNQARGTDQSKHLRSVIRFECLSGHAWTVDARDAEAHGRFLQRLEAQ